MSSRVPSASTALTADPAVAAWNPATARTDRTRRKRWGMAVLRIAAAVSAAHAARIPF